MTVDVSLSRLERWHDAAFDQVAGGRSTVRDRMMLVGSFALMIEKEGVDEATAAQVAGFQQAVNESIQPGDSAE